MPNSLSTLTSTNLHTCAMCSTSTVSRYENMCMRDSSSRSYRKNNCSLCSLCSLSALCAEASLPPSPCLGLLVIVVIVAAVLRCSRCSASLTLADPSLETRYSWSSAICSCRDLSSVLCAVVCVVGASECASLEASLQSLPVRNACWGVALGGVTSAPALLGVAGFTGPCRCRCRSRCPSRWKSAVNICGSSALWNRSLFAYPLPDLASALSAACTLSMEESAMP
mmetsp:Transcript_27055/g.59850  ORF Transcript_27055/g.59850 Transcript_27055/m.59850 type:complete len:225 (+) Transcript_27055:943-1617(+)